MNPSKSSTFPKFYHEEIETMDRERLEALQLDRVKWQVKRCYECSGFYKERFDRIGLKPGDINSLDDIVKIPQSPNNNLETNSYPIPPLADT